MGKQWYKLSIFVYNKNGINKTLKYLVQLINESDFLKKQVIISKKWHRGPHIEMLYALKKETLYLMDNLVQEVKQYLILHPFEQTESYEKYIKLSERLAQLEEYNGKIIPLRKHLEVVNQRMNWKELETIFPVNTFIEVQTNLSNFLCDTYSYFSELDAREQDVFLARCMIILGNQQEDNDPVKGGIQYGYMTFQSHYYGFVSQLDLRKVSEKKIFNELQRIDSEIVKCLVDKMNDTILPDVASVGKFNESFKYLALWQGTVIKLLETYEELFDKNQSFWDKNHNINTFLTRNRNQLSQFHNDLKQSKQYLDFLNTRFFQKHRLTINAFYTMLPLFGVSPLRKHKLCKYVADSVEQFYHQDYSSVMKKINRTFINQ